VAPALPPAPAALPPVPARAGSALSMGAAEKFHWSKRFAPRFYWARSTRRLLGDARQLAVSEKSLTAKVASMPFVETSSTP
jgi:hypothetical protein